MLRNILLAAAVLAAVAGCRMKGDPDVDAVKLTCTAVSSACAENADCCSYGCLNHVCVPNTVEGGVCRTTDDCTHTMTCVEGACRMGFTCKPSVGDTCTYNNDCCSGNCLGENTSVYPATPGHCGTQTAPVAADATVTVPYYATAALGVSVSDPDVEDVHLYGWSVVSVPPGGLAAGWSASGPTPSFFPSTPGTYTFRVRVTDGPSTQRSRTTDEAIVTVHAVNQPPVVSTDPTAVVTTLRNNPLSLVGSVSDPNLNAAVVSCAWYKKPPAGIEAPVPGGTWASCPPSPQVSFTPPIDGPEGDWTFRLEASDGELVTSSVRVIEVVNAAPVAEACAGSCAAPPAGGLANLRVGNLGPPGEPAPAIPLTGSATDANLDVGTAGFTWQWIVDAVPSGSSVATGMIASGSGAAPFNALFDPDVTVTGTYVLRLHVEDGWGGSADDTVDVVVDPYLRPLHPLDATTKLPRGDVADAAYAHATDRIVFAGYDTSSLSNRLWVLDPESVPTTFGPSEGLSASAICLGVKPDGSEAIVAETGPYWQRVSLSTTPPAANSANTFEVGFGTPTSIVYAKREYATSTSGAVHELGTSAGNSSTQAGCTGFACTPAAGTRAVSGQLSATDYVWILDERSGELRRYLSSSNGNLDLNPGTVASNLGSSHALWLSAVHGTSQAEVIAGEGTVLGAGSMATVTTLPATRHLDSTAISTVLRAVAVNASGTEVRKLDESYASAGALPLPRIGYAGTGYPLDARYAFIRTDGTAHYVLVRAFVASAYRWYLVKY